MINLNPTDSRPLYEQIVEKLRDLIIAGYLKENDKIPSVRELAAKLAINPNTIQKAYKLLELEGYIHSKPAKGYFVGVTQESESRIPLLEKQLGEIVEELSFLGVSRRELEEIIENHYKN